MIYPWVVLNSGCELRISPEIKGAKYVSLISDMLSADPDDRPTALEVLKRLQAPEVPDGEPILEEPFPEHGILLMKKEIAAAGIIKLEKVIEGSRHEYRLLTKDGKKQILTKEEMLSRGYAAPASPAGFEATWPEHHIAFDMDKLKLRGFVAGKKETRSGINGYLLYRADGQSTFFRVEMLLAMKYAVKQADGVSAFDVPDAPSDFAEPWPEHSIAFDEDAARSKGYVASVRKTLNGVKGYEFVRANGSRQFIRAEMVVIQKIAHRV